MAEHIHTPGDGRGLRNVFVNGNLINDVVYANTKKGEAYFIPRPFRLTRSKDEVYTRKLTGVVTVERIN